MSGAAAAVCSALATLALPDTTISSAKVVAAAAGPVADAPAICRVIATARPTRDSNITFEVWLPDAGWNGKLLAVGNGAYGGSIPYPALAAGVRKGYATVATDTGHTGSGAAFALNAPEKLRDFIDRAVHEMTVKAKAIVASHYGRAPDHSYFNGCSTGGRQALTAAQRYPADFDGIIAGSPGNYTTRQAFGQVWVAQALQGDAASRLPAAKLPVIHKAVLAACDKTDGVDDGVLADPTKCSFDPASLLCAAGDGPQCLTAPQVEAVRKTYAGATHPRTGEQIFPGFERGSELEWGRWLRPQPADYATDFFKYLVFKDSSWDFRTLTFDTDLAPTTHVRGIDAIDPDLRPFFSRGGRLLIYAGWNDPGIAPRNAVNYYNDVVKTVGAPEASDHIRLFMVPGMAHCGGGQGLNTFDMLAALESWVEKNMPPSRIPATRLVKGHVEREGVLCPYPEGCR